MTVALNPSSRPPRGLWSPVGLDAVEALMHRLAGAPGPLDGILREHLSTGGKRLRARLALATADALGVPREQVVGWAAACELLHNASLLHDDLQDGDRVRRGHQAAWARHGVAQAINAGDLGLMLPWQAVSEVAGDDALRWTLGLALSQHACRVARGQAAELTLLPARRLKWPDYAWVAREKTAALFSLPVLGVAHIAGLSTMTANALAADLEALGVLFQVQDDVLDLFGAKERPPGSDLSEGKVTALVVEHLRLHPSERGAVIALLERGSGDELTVAATTRRFRDGGALRAVWDRMGELEHEVVEAPVLSAHPRLQAVALELVAGAVAPIAHTAPAEILGGGH